MKYEVTAYFECGSITVVVDADYYGDGSVEDGVARMCEGMFPNAKHIDAYPVGGANQ